MIDDRHASAVAIVGMSGRFPGAGNLDEFWENLRTGTGSVTDFSPEELVADGADPAEVAKDAYIPAKGVLSGADRFDADLFGFSPRDAELLDPQHRLLLECAWSALEDAGYDPRAVPDLTGVYVGGGLTDHAVAVLSDPRLHRERGRTQLALLTDRDTLASWISFRLGLGGPSIAVSTACSTSLTAVHMAVQSLLLGECDIAVAGGVGIDTPARRGYLHQEGGIASADGRCRPFDADSSGTVAGNGVGLVVLRRHEDALRAGDRVHCLIRGSAVTNDGSAKIGFTAPGTAGQVAAITQALDTAQVAPREIQYVEMHGTGTALGDEIEVSAITEAFGGSAGTPQWCGIGSVKSNIGHLDTAAGVAGLLKTVLMLKNRQFVPTVNFTAPNPALGLDATPFHVVDRTGPWPRPDGGARLAGVSSIGMGGTNVHMVLEEAPDQEERSATGDRPELLVLSALTERGLTAAGEALAARLEQADGVPLSDIAHTLRRGRAELETRGYVVANGRTDAARRLRSLTPSPARTAAAPVLVLADPSTPRPGAGAELYATFAAFREAFGDCAKHLSDRHGIDLEPPAAHHREPGTVRDRHTALFGLAYATARLWSDWGIAPSVTVGHGIGEYVAAVTSGLLSLHDALDLVVTRADLIARTEPGRMVTVGLPASGTAPLLADGMALAAVLGPRACVVSGPIRAMDEFTAGLTAAGTRWTAGEERHALNSPCMDPVLDEFEAKVAGIRFGTPSGTQVSGVDGARVAAGRMATAGYWRDHLRGTLRLGDAIEAAGRISDGALLWIGGGPAGAPLPDRPCHTVFGEAGEASGTLAALGALWAAGHPVTWSVPPSGFRRAHLPGYVFDGRSYGAYRLFEHDGGGPAVESEPADPAEEKGQDADPVRAQVVELLIDTLGVGPDEFGLSFIAAGGDSMGSVHLVSRIEDALGVEVPVALLLTGDSLDELATQIAELKNRPAQDPLIEDLLLEVQAEG
ncbi:type I polyketide synthase [Streptomyces fuscichromogenes]|uniref:type I polyketide synthase n=1 Tax=Streptomyces fuscichromogenes TaxID=1324013 RepID=UPI0038101D17